MNIISVCLQLVLLLFVYYFLAIKPVIVFFQIQNKTIHQRLNKLSITYCLISVAMLLFPPVATIFKILLYNVHKSISYPEITAVGLVYLLLYFGSCVVLISVLWLYNLFYYSYYYLINEKKDVL
jgi:hypothetical protein